MYTIENQLFHPHAGGPPKRDSCTTKTGQYRPGRYSKQAQKLVQVDALEILCNTLQLSVTLCKTLLQSVTPYNTLQYSSMLCNTLEYPAIPCNTL